MEAGATFKCPCGRHYTARAIRHDQSKTVFVRVEVLNDNVEVISFGEEVRDR